MVEATISLNQPIDKRERGGRPGGEASEGQAARPRPPGEATSRGGTASEGPPGHEGRGAQHRGGPPGASQTRRPPRAERSRGGRAPGRPGGAKAEGPGTRRESRGAPSQQTPPGPRRRHLTDRPGRAQPPDEGDGGRGRGGRTLAKNNLSEKKPLEEIAAERTKSNERRRRSETTKQRLYKYLKERTHMGASAAGCRAGLAAVVLQRASSVPMALVCPIAASFTACSRARFTASSVPMGPLRRRRQCRP